MRDDAWATIWLFKETSIQRWCLPAQRLRWPAPMPCWPTTTATPVISSTLDMACNRTPIRMCFGQSSIVSRSERLDDRGAYGSDADELWHAANSGRHLAVLHRHQTRQSAHGSTARRSHGALRRDRWDVAAGRTQRGAATSGTGCARRPPP